MAHKHNYFIEHIALRQYFSHRYIKSGALQKMIL